MTLALIIAAVALVAAVALWFWRARVARELGAIRRALERKRNGNGNGDAGA